MKLTLKESIEWLIANKGSADITILVNGVNEFESKEAISNILSAVGRRELVIPDTSEHGKFYHKDWSYEKRSEARKGKLITDDGEAWRYEYTHTDGVGGEYDMCFRLKKGSDISVILPPVVQ